MYFNVANFCDRTVYKYSLANTKNREILHFTDFCISTFLNRLKKNFSWSLTFSNGQINYFLCLRVKLFFCVCLSNYYFFFAFPCDAKWFAVACLILFLPFLALFLDGLAKVFSSHFIIRYPRTVWPGSGYFIGRTGRCFCQCSFSCKFSVYEYNIPCALEININRGFKREREILLFNHQKHFSTDTRSVATKGDRVVTAHEGIPPTKSPCTLIKKTISPIAQCLWSSKFAGFVTYLGSLTFLAKTSCSTLIIWPSEITWQIKTIISPLP